MGPSWAGQWLWEHGGLSHARLSIIDLAGGHQPMVKSGSGQTFAIVYNGELYNTDELRRELMAAGCSFQSSSDTRTPFFSPCSAGGWPCAAWKIWLKSMPAPWLH